jgi:hypothetical protein
MSKQEGIPFIVIEAKLSLCSAIKMYGEVEVQLHVFLTLALGGRFVPPPPNQLDRRLSGPQRRYRSCGEEINLFLIQGIELGFLCCPARDPLHRLSYPGSYSDRK